jgi:hypothetical protein
MTPQSIRLQVASHLQDLPSDQVKELVLQWLLEPDSDLVGLSHRLEGAMELGEISVDGDFRARSEDEMIEQSLAALQQYRESDRAVSHESIKQWADRLSQ